MTETATRTADLRRMLCARRREMYRDVRDRIREGRADRAGDVGDDLEQSDADIQDELELALLGMRAEAVIRIDAALARLEAGEYGACVTCAGRIAAQRLRALPFAVRCRACEELREQEQGEARRVAGRRRSSPRVPDLTGLLG